MALHFYMNGTTGAQDGVEISNGDLSNPLVFDGFYAASGVTLSKTKTIHIRADAGEIWKVVTIVVTDSNKTNACKFTINIPNALKWVVSANSPYGIANFYPQVSDTNLPIKIKAYVVGGETSPIISSKITVIGGIKI